MTTLTERHDAQTALDRPMTLAEAGRRAERVNTAMAHLFDVAQQDVRLGQASTAVVAVGEAKR